MRRIDLVAGKNNTCKLDPETRGGRARRLEVGAKCLDVAPLLQAIEMREGMRSDFLGRVVENPLDEGEAVIIRVALLVWADLVEVIVGGKSRVAVARLARGECGAHRRVGGEEQKPDGRPRAGDAALGEEVEQGGNDLADAENVRAVIRNRAVVTNAPQQFEIQRNNKRAILHCAPPRR